LRISRGWRADDVVESMRVRATVRSGGRYIFVGCRIAIYTCALSCTPMMIWMDWMMNGEAEMGWTWTKVTIEKGMRSSLVALGASYLAGVFVASPLARNMANGVTRFCCRFSVADVIGDVQGYCGCKPCIDMERTRCIA
jgi:hypothetical protein